MRRFVAVAARAPGVVIDLVWQTSTDSEGSQATAAHPKVRFLTRSGREQVFTSATGSSPAQFRVDQPVTVLYDPENPAYAYIRSFQSLWAGPIVICAAGALFLSVGALTSFFTRTIR
jgi:hypothetical protein